MKRAGEFSHVCTCALYSSASRDSLRSSDVALSQSGALSLVCAFVAICQKHSSPELTESVTEAVAAMSRFPALHQGLIMEGDALSLLAPLCLEDFGIQRQEASLGVRVFSTQFLLQCCSIVRCRNTCSAVFVLRFNRVFCDHCPAGDSAARVASFHY